MLAYHYPPAPEVGGLRALKIVESFARRGATVEVIAAPADAIAAVQPPDGVRVHRLPPGLDMRTIYKRLRRRNNGATAGSNEPGAGESAWAPPERTPAIKRHISAAMWLPDDRQGWIRPAARLATRLVRSGADLLYSTAPPFSVHLAALLARRRTGVRWVVEFRDPWTDNPWKPEFVRSAWSDACERWLEKRCIQSADQVVAVTDSAAERLRARLDPNDRHKVVVVRNGIDRLEPVTHPPTTVRTVVYVGSLYQGRDPRPFLNALSTLSAEGGLAADFRVEFIGDCRWLQGVSIEDHAREIGIADLVHFAGRLDHADCLDRIRNADLLLLLAQDQPLQVPNKLYEYLGARRPVLAFADRGGETTSMLERIGGHYIVDRDDPALIERMVRQAIAGPGTLPRSQAESLLREWTSERQLETLYDSLRAGLR